MTRRGRETPNFFVCCAIMARRDSRSLVRICVCLAFLAVTLATDEEECDIKKCPGPLAYYKALGCTPVYKTADDCCAIKYNCDHLQERSRNKCYVNGNTYELGEALKDEDANPCDIHCYCVERNGVARFVCAEVDCFPRYTPGCYIKRSPLNCCSMEQACPEKPEDRATCNVDGEIYKDGEYFEVKSEPDLTCICQPGYTGENVEPFCMRPRRPYCSPDFRYAGNIFANCTPVYYSNQSPQTECNVASRCQNERDVIIHNHKNDMKSDNQDDTDVCIFGNMTMHRGDELNQATHYSSVCVKCVCEVPPLPTCQRLPDSECDVTKHPPFQN